MKKWFQAYSIPGSYDVLSKLSVFCKLQGTGLGQGVYNSKADFAWANDKALFL
jgi:hypothetical protein